MIVMTYEGLCDVMSGGVVTDEWWRDDLMWGGVVTDEVWRDD